ncbi:MAG TPA: UvrD-helicase domain-containing protein [Ramlibacter sp.]|nr:UvrD-helicase domain-containing protein [Ramlibacter sp.]
MSTRKPALAYEHDGKRVQGAHFYEIACDPRRSVAVEACAGAGKTWMLVSRILRALLDGTQPHEILAITFTKKAAGEMRERLHKWLAQFSVAGPDQLREELAMRGIAQPSAEQVAGLKGLHARLLASGRPVQVRTFHSWFAALLRTAPLAVLEELRLPANYELLERDDEAIELVWRRFYTTVARDDVARADYEASVAAHGRTQTQKALGAALDKRVEFAFADERGIPAESVRRFDEQFPQFGGCERPEDRLRGDIARHRWMQRATQLGAQKNKTPLKAADAIVTAFLGDDLEARFEVLRKAFFVAGEDRLNANLVKYAAAQEAEAELREICEARCQHEAWLHQQRMTRLARIVIEEFAALKRERGWVDMNDVERAAMRLLSDEVLSGWVQEKLDARTRHLLIDEFQDTNPLQWHALGAWLEGYAGAGNAPAVFIVGDPKQSIYRFRRAEPLVFKAAQAFIRDGLGGDILSCDHTRRNSPQVLDVVNQAMAAAQDEGLYEGFRAHTTGSNDAGAVLRLPRIERDAIAKPQGIAQAWRDSLLTPRELPEEKLLQVEARQAAAWIASRIAAGTPAAQVMVLARKRSRLSVLEAELRELHVPAQQPERADLCDAPEVRDIVALLDVLVSPSHDLSLARALKSPLFGFDDDALVEIALAARAQPAATWFELLRDDAAAKLARWKSWVDVLPPHDALAAIYADADVLARFAAAAPGQMRSLVVARLRALLGAALDWNGGRYPTPYSFVRAMKAGGIDAPAAESTNAVNLLTVHGAKGLEADVVLLLDTDSAPQNTETMGVVVEWPAEAPSPWRFSFLASEKRPPACHEDALAVERTARMREELNGLYVAMTRARRELVISAIAPHRVNEGSWWRRLEALATPVEAPPARALPGVAASHFPLAAIAKLPDPAGQPSTSARDSLQSRIGQAMHRLLETMQAGARFTPAQLRRVARDFSLGMDQAEDAARMAQSIAQGEGAWAWDPAAVDWQGNEVALHHEGELLRIDRLVRRTALQEWWVLDYKSATQPERRADLVQQMQRYRQAVQALHGANTVHAAFLTADGRIVRVP